EAGICTSSWRAARALRIRVNISAIGSVIIRVLLHTSGDYQLDLTTPGISPRRAKPRKQIRHMANFRRYPRALPHTRQRLYKRTANFGVLFALLMSDFFAILLFRFKLSFGKAYQAA